MIAGNLQSKMKDDLRKADLKDPLTKTKVASRWAPAVQA